VLGAEPELSDTASNTQNKKQKTKDVPGSPEQQPLLNRCRPSPSSLTGGAAPFNSNSGVPACGAEPPRLKLSGSALPARRRRDGRLRSSSRWPGQRQRRGTSGAQARAWRGARAWDTDAGYGRAPASCCCSALLRETAAIQQVHRPSVARACAQGEGRGRWAGRGAGGGAISWTGRAAHSRFCGCNQNRPGFATGAFEMSWCRPGVRPENHRDQSLPR
jgi:hypothetical protein